MRSSLKREARRSVAPPILVLSPSVVRQYESYPSTPYYKDKNAATSHHKCLVGALLHLEGDVAGALANGKRPALRSWVESLHRPRAVSVNLRDVELSLVQTEVVLRVGRGGEQGVEHGLARAVRHELEHDEALLVGLAANHVQHPPDLFFWE